MTLSRGFLLRRDATLIGVVRDESTRFDATGGLRRLEVADTMPLPPLCVITRRASAGAPSVLTGFVDALRRAARRARPQRRLLTAKT